MQSVAILTEGSAMIKLMASDSWITAFGSEPLCTLELSLNEFLSRFEIECNPFAGETNPLVVEFYGQLYRVSSQYEATGKPVTTIDMQGNNANPAQALAKFQDAVLSGVQLIWLRDDLTPPRWALFRQGVMVTRWRLRVFSVRRLPTLRCVNSSGVGTSRSISSKWRGNLPSTRHRDEGQRVIDPVRPGAIFFFNTLRTAYCRYSGS